MGISSILVTQGSQLKKPVTDDCKNALTHSESLPMSDSQKVKKMKAMAHDHLHQNDDEKNISRTVTLPERSKKFKKIIDDHIDKNIDDDEECELDEDGIPEDEDF